MEDVFVAIIGCLVSAFAGACIQQYVVNNKIVERREKVRIAKLPKPDYRFLLRIYHAPTERYYKSMYGRGIYARNLYCVVVVNRDGEVYVGRDHPLLIGSLQNAEYDDLGYIPLPLRGIAQEIEAPVVELGDLIVEEYPTWLSVPPSLSKMEWQEWLKIEREYQEYIASPLLHDQVISLMTKGSYIIPDSQTASGPKSDSDSPEINASSQPGQPIVFKSKPAD